MFKPTLVTSMFSYTVCHNHENSMFIPTLDILSVVYNITTMHESKYITKIQNFLNHLLLMTNPDQPISHDIRLDMWTIKEMWSIICHNVFSILQVKPIKRSEYQTATFTMSHKTKKICTWSLPSRVRCIVTHLLGWAPFVVIAVIKLSNSSRFSWKYAKWIN
jgi:hypothetical protein